LLAVAVLASPCLAQSPELSLREFASSQIKKGVRTIGFGGDGATSGNYALVYRDEGTALIDAGGTVFTNGNAFTFTAVGATTPALWEGLTLYAIALGQQASAVSLSVASPALGSTPVPVVGAGMNQGLFLKAAMPLSHGFSVGLLLSYEHSAFDVSTGLYSVHYETQWRPSGGFGVTWQPIDRLLFGVRAILNHDWETRTDVAGTKGGQYRSYEGRLGGAVKLWEGGLADAGFTVLDRSNGLSGKHTTTIAPNVGFEQAFWQRKLVLRAGLDEASWAAGVGSKLGPVNLDLAYVFNLGSARIGPLFGVSSHSVLLTTTLDYTWFFKRALAAAAH
jgi:hypothetical protein